MEIRKYQNGDFDRMMKLHREVLIKENVYRGNGVWEDDLLNITDHYFNRHGEFIVGLENDDLIAMGAVRKINDDTAEVVRMRVHPGYQGKGCGNIILHELERFAMKNMYKELVLETDERLVNAVK
ncbi:MAG TPA: GNAT family N-acetyltransferase, partial [Spirochaetota bacterium]|nr:GNAT family N-acetyltransferase [Spirochaetota bacterium]